MPSGSMTLREAHIEGAPLFCADEHETSSRFEGLMVQDPQELRVEIFRDCIAMLSS